MPLERLVKDALHGGSKGLDAEAPLGADTSPLAHPAAPLGIPCQIDQDGREGVGSRFPAAGAGRSPGWWVGIRGALRTVRYHEGRSD